MRVLEVHDEWPERELREREWLTVAEALERVDEPGLRELLRRVFGIPQVNGFRLRGR